MNKRLDTAVQAARQTLDDAEQEHLAALVEDFLQHRSVDPEDLLTPEQLAEFDRRVAADAKPADLESVREIFRQNGLNPGF